MATALRTDPNKLNFTTLSLSQTSQKEEKKEDFQLQEKTSEAVKTPFEQARSIAGYLDGRNIPSTKRGKVDWLSTFGKFRCTEDHYKPHVMKIGDKGELIDTTPPCTGCPIAQKNIENDPKGVKEAVKAIVDKMKTAVFETITVANLTFSHYRLRESVGNRERLVYGPVTFKGEELLKGREKISFYLLHNGTLWHVIVDPKAAKNTTFLQDKNSDSMWDVTSENLKEFRKKDWNDAAVIADLSWTDVIPVPKI